MLPELKLKGTYCLKKKLCNCITFKILQVDFSPTFEPELSLIQDSPGEVWCSAFSCVAPLRYRECHFWRNCFKRKLKKMVNALKIRTSRPKSATLLFQADIDFLTRCCKAWQPWSFHEANSGLRPRWDHGWKYDSCSLGLLPPGSNAPQTTRWNVNWQWDLFRPQETFRGDSPLSFSCYLVLAFPGGGSQGAERTKHKWSALNSTAGQETGRVKGLLQSFWGTPMHPISSW